MKFSGSGDKRQSTYRTWDNEWAHVWSRSNGLFEHRADLGEDNRVLAELHTGTQA